MPRNMTLLRKIWEALREVSGEGNYARYCEHLRARHPGQPAPSQKQFYLERLKSQYTRVSRCC
jgi:uncharacterized short protein YbdD (DUF466 family)